MPRTLPNPSAKRSRAGSKRRAAGWMLLTLGLLVAGVWVASWCWYWDWDVSVYDARRQFVWSKGEVTVYRPDRIDWGNRKWPFWPLPLLLWTTGGLAFWSGRRARRRAQEGHCPTCGYNLAGLGNRAKCPECGKAKAFL